MKITKKMTIPVVAIVPIASFLLWFFNWNATKEDVKEVETKAIKIEEKIDIDKAKEIEFQMKQVEIDTRQNIMIDMLDEKIKEK